MVERKRKRSLWFYRYRFTKRDGYWYVLLKPHDPAWEFVRKEEAS